jgi:hypothetical protein
MMKDQSAFERLVHTFTVMAYVGIGVVVVGVIVGAFLQGAARVCVICFGLGSGGLMLWVGLRERKKGRKILDQLQNGATNPGPPDAI